MKLNKILENKQSIIDNRLNKNITNRQSIIDYTTNQLRTKLNDNTLGEGFVAEALNKLGEAKIINISDWVVRKVDGHKGKVFVSVCNREMRK